MFKSRNIILSCCGAMVRHPVLLDDNGPNAAAALYPRAADLKDVVVIIALECVHESIVDRSFSSFNR